jgi:hypothetical protein
VSFRCHLFFSQSPFSAQKGAKWWDKKENVGEGKRLSHHSFLSLFSFLEEGREEYMVEW